MSRFAYELNPPPGPNLGLVVLQSDQRIELDFRRLLPENTPLYITRVPSGQDVTRETLQQMEQDIPEAAALLPPPLKIQAVGYGCTSGAAQIGPDRVAELVRHGKETSAVSDPLSALRAACQTLGVRRLAILSPYIESVSARLRDVLQAGGIETPVFGGFEEASEEKVARISPASLQAAGAELAQMGGADALFLSCTNLDTLDIIEPLEAETGRPVLSSNQVLAWHLCRLAGCPARPDAPGQLFAHPA